MVKDNQLGLSGMLLWATMPDLVQRSDHSKSAEVAGGPYLNGQLGRGGPLIVVQVLHAGRKIVIAVLLLPEVPVRPPVLAILPTAPVSKYP